MASKTTTLTEAQARKRGWLVVPGAYQGTSDDRMGRWYICRVGEPLDKRGTGLSSKREALEQIATFTDHSAA